MQSEQKKNQAATSVWEEREGEGFPCFFGWLSRTARAKCASRAYFEENKNTVCRFSRCAIEPVYTSMIFHVLSAVLLRNMYQGSY